MFKRYLILFIIAILAIVLRLWQLGQNPPSLNWDEVSIGYNAYSILNTGKDEYGNFLPLIFRSMDDYKQPIYVYLTVASEKIFGLTPFAVRFPSALLGILSVLIFYFLVKELSENKKISLLSSFLLAILPWHVQFSRTAIEANVGLFFVILGLLFFSKSLKDKSWLLPFSAISLVFSMFTYLSFRVVVPLVGLIFLIAFYKKIKKGLSLYMGMVIIFLAFSFLFSDIFFQNGLTRVKGSNVFEHFPEKYVQARGEMAYDAKLKINILRKVFHDSQILTSGELVLRGYFTHFSPDFLFFYLDQKHHHAPNVGLLYIWMMPFIPLGIYDLFTKNRKLAIILILWLLASPVPASITWDIPHAIRAVAMIIPLMILTSFGIIYFFHLIGQKVFLKIISLAFLCFIVVFNGVYFIHQYSIHLPHEKSNIWVFGREKLTKYLEANKAKYDKIIISTRLEWPYIFILFYSKYDPRRYLASGGTVSGGWDEEGNRLENIEFHKFDINKNRPPGKILYVGLPDEFPGGITPSRTINYLNDEPAIFLVER